VQTLIKIGKLIFTAVLAVSVLPVLYAKQPAGPDLSDKYKAALASSQKIADKANRYKLIFVRGFLSDARDDYFGDQLKWAKENSIDALRVNIESEDSPAQNAGIITEAIRQSDKPVILITHSKGGLDSLEAFIKNPAIRSKVKGWLPLQGPFYGSPLADHFYERPVLHGSASLMLSIFGGNMGSLSSLRVAIRTPYMKRNEAEIAATLAEVPTISVACWKDLRLNPLQPQQ